MSGQAEEIGECYDELVAALMAYRELTEKIKVAESGAPVELPRGVNARSDYIEQLKTKQMDQIEKIAGAGAALVVLPYITTAQYNEEDESLPQGMIDSLMKAIDLILSRSITPGQEYFGWVLGWQDEPVEAPTEAEQTPVVEEEPDFDRDFSELMRKHRINAGTVIFREGVMWRNTLRSD